MKWKIVSDSSCDLRGADYACEETGFSTVPFFIRIGEKEYEDAEDMDAVEMVGAMEQCPELGSTSCPAPMAWADEFREAEQVIAITISKNLSGSFSSAVAGRDISLTEDPSRRIAVLNSRSTGPALAMCIGHMVEWIKEGKPFEQVTELATDLLRNTKTVFTLSCFDNLVKNGRMSKFTGFVAKKLGMWGIGIGNSEGRIAMKGKTRGVSRVVNAIIEDMRERGFRSREIIISHCQNPALAEKLRDRVLEHWSNAKITILRTRGLDSFYAERGGLIVAYN